MMSKDNITYTTISDTTGGSYMIEWINDLENSSSKIMKTIYDNAGNVIKVFADSISELDLDVHYRYVLLPQSVSKTKLVPTTEERLEGYIQDNYDRYIVHEYGSYIYQMIQEKAYDIASEVVEEAKEDYDIRDEEAVIDAILEEVDFDSLYDLVEDILHAPITMEERLAEVGMSIRDFL